MAEQINTKTMIEVKKVSKSFRLPHERTSSVKSLVMNIFRSRRFETQRALRDVSFDIKAGEFFGIVGRNGSGKSTLLKMLAGIYSPTKGHIAVNGKLTPFIELGVGFNPELTGRENVFLNGALLGFTRKEMLAMYDDIVAFAELERFMDQKLKNYSSGMQVRLAFSIAIRAKSDILLIDEVLAVGDALFQKKCFEYFSELKKTGVTVVFVSHDTEALLRYCTRGILIDQGVVKQAGPIHKIVDEYRESLMESQENQQAALTEEKGEATTKKRRKLVTIKQCKITNADGQGKKRIQSGDSFAVDLEFVVDPSLKTPVNIAVGIYNGLYESRSDYIFGASTQLDQTAIPRKTERARLTVEHPPLKNGEYILYVSVFGESEAVPYDYLPEAARFIVIGAPELNSRGAIIAEHTWKFS